MDAESSIVSRHAKKNQLNMFRVIISPILRSTI